MKAASFFGITLALLVLSPAQAHPRHHHAQRHHYVHVAAGKPIQKEWYTGPAAMPHYTAGPFDDAHVVGSPQPYRNPVQRVFEGGIVTVQTAVGLPITVASGLAGRFQALIADFAAQGYRPRHIGCFARGGHVRNSRHYAGAACDFDQSGWGRTAGFMYHAHAIIVAHGFRDGCDFRDCGHVDDGVSIGARYANHGRRRHYAHHGSRDYFAFGTLPFS